MLILRMRPGCSTCCGYFSLPNSASPITSVHLSEDEAASRGNLATIFHPTGSAETWLDTTNDNPRSKTSHGGYEEQARVTEGSMLCQDVLEGVNRVLHFKPTGQR